MDKKFNNLIHSKLFIIILILLLVCSTIFVGTYAWFTWESKDNTKLVMTIGNDIGDVVFENGNDINSQLPVVYNYNEGVSTSFSIINKAPSDKTISYVVKFNITSIADELISNDVKYALVKDNALVSEGDFSNASNGGSIILHSDILSTGTSSYVLYLYIDGNVENDSNMMGKSIVGNIIVTKDTLAGYITNLYTSNNPTLITQYKDDGTTDTYYYSYQDTDKTWGLMNDGLTIDTTQDATTTGLAKVVTDTTKLTSGTEGNIRYFGPSASVKNYIYFNCDNYSSQSESTCELWRIIGIVDGKVKIIKEDSIGNLAWDAPKNEGADTLNVNNWENASLQLFLNGLYYNRGTTTTHTYYSGDSGTTETPLNLVDIGITEATRNNNLISESTWYLGGYFSSYPNDIYTLERTNKEGTTIRSGNPYTINANIGLMYASDYVYGTDLTKCSTVIYNYQTSACTANNWLYNIVDEWLITPQGVSPNNAGYVGWGGKVSIEYGGFHIVSYASGVRPVLYLNSELVIESEHEGTSKDPYRISLS